MMFTLFQNGPTMRTTRTGQPVFVAHAPCSPVAQLNEELNRLLHRSAGDCRQPGGDAPAWVPPVDLRETEGAFVVAVELPGLKREQIQITSHDGVLTITGERLSPEGTEGTVTRRTERHFGRFHRRISLPKPIQTEATRAVYREGMLTVTLPKTPEAKPKQIEVLAD